MARLSLRSDQDISDAVNGLLMTFGVPDDSTRADEGFGGSARKGLSDGSREDPAPSATEEELWGKRRKAR